MLKFEIKSTFPMRLFLMFLSIFCSRILCAQDSNFIVLKKNLDTIYFSHPIIPSLPKLKQTSFMRVNEVDYPIRKIIFFRYENTDFKFYSQFLLLKKISTGKINIYARKEEDAIYNSKRKAPNYVFMEYDNKLVKYNYETFNKLPSVDSTTKSLFSLYEKRKINARGA